jgi:hypothetical protein
MLKHDYHQKRFDTQANLQSQVELQLGHFTADLKNDREDDYQQDV